MEMGFGLSKQTSSTGPGEQEPVHTHTHTQTQEPLCAVTLIYRKRNVLIGQPRSVMASETPLMLRERVVKSTEVCFIYSLIYSIHSEGEHQWLWQAARQASLFKVITKAESIARMFTKVGRTVFSSLVVVKGKLFTPWSDHNLQCRPFSAHLLCLEIYCPLSKIIVHLTKKG